MSAPTMRACYSLMGGAAGKLREEGYDGMDPVIYEGARLGRISEDEDHDNNYNNPP